MQPAQQSMPNDQERISIIHRLTAVLKSVATPLSEERARFLAQNLESKAFQSVIDKDQYIRAIQSQILSIKQRGQQTPAGSDQVQPSDTAEMTANGATSTAAQSVAEAVHQIQQSNQQQVNQQQANFQEQSEPTTSTSITGAPGMTIRMTPANLTEDQKAFVVGKIKEMAPMYRSINHWIEILNLYGQEKEQDMVKKLQGMKRMMEAQLEGFQVPQGVYYLTPDTVTQLQQNLYRFYTYTENLKNQRGAGRGMIRPQMMGMYQQPNSPMMRPAMLASPQMQHQQLLMQQAQMQQSQIQNQQMQNQMQQNGMMSQQMPLQNQSQIQANGIQQSGQQQATPAMSAGRPARSNSVQSSQMSPQPTPASLPARSLQNSPQITPATIMSPQMQMNQIKPSSSNPSPRITPQQVASPHLNQTYPQIMPQQMQQFLLMQRVQQMQQMGIRPTPQMVQMLQMQIAQQAGHQLTPQQQNFMMMQMMQLQQQQSSRINSSQLNSPQMQSAQLQQQMLQQQQYQMQQQQQYQLQQQMLQQQQMQAVSVKDEPTSIGGTAGGAVLTAPVHDEPTEPWADDLQLFAGLGPVEKDPSTLSIPVSSTATLTASTVSKSSPAPQTPIDTTPAPLQTDGLEEGSEFLLMSENIDSLFDFEYESPVSSPKKSNGLLNPTKDDTSSETRTAVKNDESDPTVIDTTPPPSSKKRKASQDSCSLEKKAKTADPIDAFEDFLKSPLGSLPDLASELAALESQYGISTTVTTKQDDDLFVTSKHVECKFSSLSLLFHLSSDYDGEGGEFDFLASFENGGKSGGIKSVKVEGEEGGVIDIVGEKLNGMQVEGMRISEVLEVVCGHVTIL